MAEQVNTDALRDDIEFVRGELVAIHEAAEGRDLTEDEQARFDAGTEFVADQTKVLDKLAERARAIEAMGDLPDVPTFTPPQIVKPVDPEQGLRFDATPNEVRDAGLKALERTRTDDETRHAAERTAQRVQSGSGKVYQRFILTGSDHYRSAFAKYLDGLTGAWTPEEANAVQRAASLTDAAGGFAVPFTLDPSIILTNTGVQSSVRQIARNVQITTDTWNGVSSAGVTASWDGEAAEVSDDAPTLVQPSIPVHKAQAFVPFSIEIGQDWANMDSDVRTMFADAKDRLEGAAFINGTGSDQPTGIEVELDGGAQVVAAAGEAFVLGDLYNVEAALGARYRNTNTAWLLHYGTANDIRQFDTAGGAALWERLGAGTPPELLGWSAYLDSNMDNSNDIDAAATATHSILIIGDFSNYVIVDRVGLSVELVPHLFATGNNRPSGQRGLYAYWRVGAESVNDAAFQLLEVTTTA